MNIYVDTELKWAQKNINLPHQIYRGETDGMGVFHQVVSHWVWAMCWIDSSISCLCSPCSSSRTQARWHMIKKHYNGIFRSGWVTAWSHRESWRLQRCAFFTVCICVCVKRLLHAHTKIHGLVHSRKLNCLFILTMTHLHGAHSKLALRLRSQRKRKTPGTTRRRGRAARPLRGARWSCSWRCSLGRGGLLRTENKRRSQKVSQRVFIPSYKNNSLFSLTLTTAAEL